MSLLLYWRSISAIVECETGVWWANYQVFSPLPLSTSQNHVTHIISMALNITSLNVKGLKSPLKRHLLWKKALRLNADLICVQKTHLFSLKPPSFFHNQFPHCVFANSPKKKAGVLITIRSTVVFQLIHSEIDKFGMYIILHASINNHTMTIVNLHAPNIHQGQFYKIIGKTNTLSTTPSNHMWRL